MLTRDEKLILLIEECGDVIQAATKILRFGWDRSQPNYGVNHEVLSVEIGDMLVARAEGGDLHVGVQAEHLARRNLDVGRLHGHAA